MNNRFEKWMPWLIVVAGIAAYINGLPGPFVFDDEVTVGGVKGLIHWWPFRPGCRTLVDLTFVVNHALTGGSPAGYRAVNILLHIAAALFLYGFVRRTLILPRWKGLFSIPEAAALAGVTALFWLVHPIQTESVTYISQRYEVVMGMLGLAVMYSFVRAEQSARPRLWINTGLAACLLGMASKETMAMVPAVLLLYDLTFISGDFRTLIRARWRIHLAFLSTWGVLAALLAGSGSARVAAHATLVQVIEWQRYLWTQAEVILHYLRLSFVPYPLCLDYGWPLVGGLREAIVPVALLSVLGVGVFLLVLRRNAAGFAGAWFFLMLAPTSSIVPLPDPAVEHRMYLPLASVIAMTVIWIHRTAKSRLETGVFRIIERAVCIALVCTLICMSILRNQDYRSEEGLWRDVVVKKPGNLRGWMGLGAALARQGDWPEARETLRYVVSCIEDGPTGWQANSDKMTLYCSSFNILGSINQREGKLAEAKRDFEAALNFCPMFTSARVNKGVVLRLEGRRDEAVHEWETALEMDPEYVPAHRALASLFLEEGRFSEGVHHLEAAISINRTLVEARLLLAWVLATCPDDKVRDGRRALELARKTGRVSGQEWQFADVLGAAYAEIGNFMEAVRLAREAYSRAPETYTEREELKERIAGYEEGKPWRVRRTVSGSAK